MRVIIADDHALIRDTLALLLRELATEMEVLHADTFAATMDLVKQPAAVDLLLLDLRMPGMNGLAGVKALGQACGAVPIIIVSAETNPDVIRGSMREGVAGYIPKTMRGNAMLNALRLVLSGERYVPQSLVSEPDLPRRGDAGQPGRLESLTTRESAALSGLIRGLSNKEIARELNIEEITVALYLRTVYKKLGVATRTQAVRYALDAGWNE
ncbi:MAG: response regulator transcription factor [Dongiaceae bacterium]